MTAPNCPKHGNLVLELARGRLDDREAMRAEVDLFLAHLRAHFDDIHDVSMRFHADDPWIEGTIILGMDWRDGRGSRCVPARGRA